MMGYLHRLAASAARPRGPVHPVVQPIFSAAMEARSRDLPDLDEFSGRSDAETPPHSKERAAEPQRQSNPGHASEPAAANAPKPAPELPSPPLVQAHVVAAAPTPSDVRPRLPARQHRDNPDDADHAQQAANGSDHEQTDKIRLASPPLTRAGRAPPQSDIGTAQTGANERGDDDRDSHRRQASSERVFVPLLASVTSANEPAPSRVARPPAVAARRAPRLIQGERSAASEPNEVQIHIGRIEVTAIAQAPARAPVAAPRRSGMSLDDYLKQRNGRAS
jgi:hypothetical protein